MSGRGKTQLIKIIIFGSYTQGITVFNFFLFGEVRIVGYKVGNLVLRRRVSGTLKRDFGTYIRRYTSPNEILNMVESRIEPHVIQENVT